MSDRFSSVNRREWFSSCLAATVLGSTLNDRLLAGPEDRLVPVAGVATVYTRNSHADVLLGKILEGYRQDGGEGPRLKLASLYVDQFPSSDLSRKLADRYGVRLCQTIDDALTWGTGKLQVKGVLSIGEHGEYPLADDTGQREYPRRRFFDEIVKVLERTEQVIPVFNDKHLAWNWRDASAMYRAAERLGFPFMAGSSLPVAWREPRLSLPIGCRMKSAVAVGYGGLEAYGFHALETLQCMVERRAGGETGLESVRCVTVEQLRNGQEQFGEEIEQLIHDALQSLPKTDASNWRQRLKPGSGVYLLRYRDGLQAAVAMLNGVARQFGFAARLADRTEAAACWFRLEETAPFGHFEFQLRAIEAMMLTGQPAYPVERTLLTTGALDALMHSHAWEGAEVRTSHLDIRYRPHEWPFANSRESGINGSE